MSEHVDLLRQRAASYRQEAKECLADAKTITDRGSKRRWRTGFRRRLTLNEVRAASALLNASNGYQRLARQSGREATHGLR